MPLEHFQCWSNSIKNMELTMEENNKNHGNMSSHSFIFFATPIYSLFNIKSFSPSHSNILLDFHSNFIEHSISLCFAVIGCFAKMHGFVHNQHLILLNSPRFFSLSHTFHLDAPQNFEYFELQFLLIIFVFFIRYTANSFFFAFSLSQRRNCKTEIFFTPQ